jgi:hypothetical protein
MAFRFFHDAAARSKTEIGVEPVFSAKTSSFSLFCLLLMPVHRQERRRNKVTAAKPSVGRSFGERQAYENLLKTHRKE